MEVRSIRKLETRHVNLKPTERSEGGFKFTCRVSNFRIDRYRHSLTDLYTGSFVSLQQTPRRNGDWISRIFMSAMSYCKCLFSLHDVWQNNYTCKASKLGDWCFRFHVYRLIQKTQKNNSPLRKRFKDVLDHIFIFWNVVFLLLLFFFPAYICYYGYWNKQQSFQFGCKIIGSQYYWKRAYRLTFMEIIKIPFGNDFACLSICC